MPTLFTLTAEDLAATCQSDSGGEDPTVLLNVGEDWTQVRLLSDGSSR